MKNPSFPWKIFRKFYFKVFLHVVCVVIAVFLIDLVFLKKLHIELEIGLFVIILLGFTAFSSVLISYQIVRPFRRVLLRAIQVASNKRARSLFTEEDWQELRIQDPGEFSDLEEVLTQIDEKLRKRKEQLASERQESQALLSAIEHGIVTLNLDFKILNFNSEFATHFLSRDQLRSYQDEASLYLELIFRDRELLDAFAQAKKSGDVLRTLCRLQSYMQDSVKTFAVSISPLRDERNRQTYGVLALFQDVTDLKVADQIRIEFVENASHELRTPLTSIKGFLETLREDFESKTYDQIPHFLSILRKNVDRLIDLVNDMLTLSSLEHHSELRLDSVDLASVTQEVMERLSPLAAEKQISFRSSVSVQQVRADEKKIVHVLTNLIGNSIKYIPVGGHIQIYWETYLDNFVRLRVVDDGPGIAPEHLDRLFERFYRIDKGRSRDVGGTGLGLAIVKHIVQSHGGRVLAKSSLGGGCEFICDFPRESELY